MKTLLFLSVSLICPAIVFCANEGSCTKFEEGLYLNFALNNSSGVDKFLDSMYSCGNEDPETYLKTGKFYYKNKEYNTALQELSKTIKASSATEKEIGEAHYYMALAYLYSGKYDESIRESENAIKADYLRAWSNFNIGYALYFKKEYQKAQEYYTKAIALDKSYDKAWNNMGVCFDRMEDYKSALRCYQIADTLSGGSNPLAKSNMIKALRNLDRDAEAFALTISAGKMFPDDVNLMEDNAYMLSDLKKFNESIEVSRRIIALDETNFEPYFRIGYCYDQTAKLDSALYYYNLAIKYNPTCKAAYHNTGWILKVLGMFEKAREYQFKALALDSTEESYYHHLWNSYYWDKDFEKALEWASEYYHRFPRGINGNMDMGCSLQALGRYEDAIPYFKGEIKDDPKDTKPFNNIGRCLAQLGKYDQAMAYFDTALLYAPGNAYVFHNRAALYYDLKIYDKACADLQKALDLQYTWIIDEKLEKMAKEHCPDVNTNMKVVIHEYRGNEQKLVDANYSFIELLDSLSIPQIDLSVLDPALALKTDNTQSGEDAFNNYTLFPNPSSGMFYVQSKVQNTEEELTVKVYDYSGKLVLKESMTSSRKELNIASFPAGIYFVLIMDDQGVLSSQELVLTK